MFHVLAPQESLDLLLVERNVQREVILLSACLTTEIERGHRRHVATIDWRPICTERRASAARLTPHGQDAGRYGHGVQIVFHGRTPADRRRTGDGQASL